MEPRYWIYIGIIVVILIVGVSIKLYTKKKLKEIDGFQGIFKRDENGTLIPVTEDNSKKGEKNEDDQK